MTEKTYLNYSAMEPASLNTITQISHIDRKEGYLLLNKTIFHPQGGGQKSDSGTIATSEDIMTVTMVTHTQEGDVKHFGEIPPSFEVGHRVNLQIDPIKRNENAAYHTGGHLLACIAEQCCPQLKAVKGHHWPGEAKVEFDITGPEALDKEQLLENLRHATQEAILADLPVFIEQQDNGMRYIRIGTFGAVPCGGTHLATLRSLQQLNIKQAKKKADRLFISYSL